MFYSLLWKYLNSFLTKKVFELVLSLIIFKNIWKFEVRSSSLNPCNNTIFANLYTFNNYRSNDELQEIQILIDDLLILFVLHACKCLLHSKEYILFANNINYSFCHFVWCTSCTLCWTRNTHENQSYIFVKLLQDFILWTSYNITRTKNK